LCGVMVMNVFDNLLRSGSRSRTAFFLLFFSAVMGLFASPASARTYVRMETVLGDIDVELFDNITPLTVANFLNYVDDADYDNTFIHRSHAGYQIIQGGGFKFENGLLDVVPTDPPIVLEYNLPNERGTIAMARTAEPDSATSGWFFNHGDNSDIWGPQNGGGYAVFGRVIGNGMDVVDAIAAVQVWNAGSPFDTLPLIDYPVDITDEYLVMIPRISRTHGPVGLLDLAEHWLDSGCDDSARGVTDWCDGTDLSQEGWVNFIDLAFAADAWANATPGPYEGNFNGDNIVNMVDFAIFTSAWATTSGDAKYNSACDLYYDGAINELDLMGFAYYWLYGDE